MPVPASLEALSTTAASNPPAGSEAVAPLLDDHLRFGYSALARLRDEKAAKGSNNDITALSALATVPTVVTTAINNRAAKGANGDITSLTALASVPTVVTTAINNATPDASTTVKGKVQLATAAEAVALTDAAKAITPSTLAGAFRSSNQSTAANGFQRLPGGLIIQWGTVSGTGVDQSVSFPIPFPTAALTVIANMLGVPAGNVSLSCTVDQISASNFTARPRFSAVGSAGVATQGFNWFAVGF